MLCKKPVLRLVKSQSCTTTGALAVSAVTYAVRKPVDRSEHLSGLIKAAPTTMAHDRFGLNQVIRASISFGLAKWQSPPAVPRGTLGLC
jgi:hypothetical protein